MPEFIERASHVDTIESSYTELSRSYEYSDETRYTIDELKEKSRYWHAELQNASRSERSKEEAARIVELLIFEIALREKEFNAALNAMLEPSPEDTI